MGDPAYDARYLRGIDEFNRREFFVSHEIWEDLWRAETGPQRQFYQGLIQAAVALHHLTRGNAHGANKLLAGSRRHLRPFRPAYLGLDVEAFLGELGRCVTAVTMDGAASIDQALVPCIRLGR
jgi:uncharacterized protein